MRARGPVVWAHLFLQTSYIFCGQDRHPAVSSGSNGNKTTSRKLMEGTELARLLAQTVQCPDISSGFHLKLQRTGACVSGPMDACLWATMSAGSDLSLTFSRLPRRELW